MKALTNYIGHPFTLGHNGAKQLGNEYVAFEVVRVEAIGCGWLVVRTASGEPLAATFDNPSHVSSQQMIKELEE
jgi:hypothetical protein